MGSWFIRREETLTPAALALVEVVRHEPYNTGKLRNADWVLDYSFSGYGLFRAGARMRDYATRDAHIAHLYPPETPYWEDTRHSPESRHSAWLIFRGAEALRLDRLVDPEWGFAQIVDTAGELGKLLMQTARRAAAAGEEDGFYEAQAGLYRIARALRHSTRDDDPPWRRRLAAANDGDVEGQAAASGTDGDREWIARARELIGRDPFGPLDLDGLARRMHCSRSGFSHRFRKLDGQSPGAYRMGLRINAACILLDSTRALKEIAERTGFHDEFHLSRAFKKAIGLSPTEYRRQRRAPSGKI